MKNEPEIIENSTENILATTFERLTEGLRNITEGATGIATSSRSDLILSVSHIFQRMRGRQFLSLLMEEWNRYREKGRVKDDYQFTEQHKACLIELLDSIEKDCLDETRFAILKQIFLAASMEMETDRESFLPLQFMKIARSLETEEVLLLSAIWRMLRPIDNRNAADFRYREWRSQASKLSGLIYPELFAIYENKLVEKRLLLAKEDVSSGTIFAEFNRFTKLGYHFCKFVYSYENLDADMICLCCQKNQPCMPFMCPECGHVFQGNGWDGIDAHWRSKHEDVMPYEDFWRTLCDSHRKGPLANQKVGDRECASTTTATATARNF